MHVNCPRDGLSLVECFSTFPLGVVRQALHPQVPWLHQRQSPVLQKERDRTLTLFLTSSASTSATSPRSSEEEGLHFRPSSSQQQWLPRRKRELHLTLVRRNASGYFGGGATGSPPHTSGVYFASRAVDGKLSFGGVDTAHYTGVFAYINFENTSYSPICTTYLGNQVDGEFPIAPLLVSVQIRARCRYRAPHGDFVNTNLESTSNWHVILAGLDLNCLSPSCRLRV